jgi:LPS-assembly lipoprotein
LLSKISLLVFFCLIVSACGFKPLYGTKGSENITADFFDIRVAPIKGRIGQMLSNELKYLLNPLHEPYKPKNRLIIDTVQSIRSLAVKKTALATRSNLKLRSQYRLIDTSSLKLLSSGSNEITVSFNIYSSNYATLTAEKDAKKRAVKELAQDIRLQLGAFFTANNHLNLVK